MKEKNIKPAFEIQTKIDLIDWQLNAWEHSKTLDCNPTIQIRESPLNPQYYKVDLSIIPFKALRQQFLTSLNEQRAVLKIELNKLLTDD